MAVPFSNTKLRVPQGFRNLLEDFTREVLRNQPDDIFIFGAKYFQQEMTNRNSNNTDLCKDGANEEDRFYNTKMWKDKEAAMMCTEKLNEAAQIIQKDYKMLLSSKNMRLLSRESAAVNIQRMFRGFSTRKRLNSMLSMGSAAREQKIQGEFVQEEDEHILSHAAFKITAAFIGVAGRNAPEDVKLESVFEEGTQED